MDRTPAVASDDPDVQAVLRRIASVVAPTFYVVDISRFEANISRFLKAFRSIYPTTELGYSYKTNYLPRFVRRASELGLYSEVVSRFEYDYARALGVPADRIIFNGPIKRRIDLEAALRGGSIVNLDSLAEVPHLLAIGRDADEPTPYGVRCFLGSATEGSRFGLDLQNPDALEALGRLAASPGLRLAGLHCHYSGGRRAASYSRITAELIRAHQQIFGGQPIDYIDVGGGFASNMSPALAAQFDEVPPTASEYADAIATEMKRAYGDGGPKLILEPGMALLADTMTLVTRVEAIKRQADRNVAVVDGSIFNIKPLRGALNLPVDVISGVHGAERRTATWDVVGHTCMEVDLMHRGFHGQLAEGDLVVVENVGAYTNVLNAPFIRGTPPVVELESTGWRLLRRESSVSDLIGSYQEAE